jgi:hypothetical protein
LAEEGSGGGVEAKARPTPVTLDDKMARLNEIFPGCGASITVWGKFTTWATWGYDWDLDIETTFREIAHRQPGFRPQSLNYFDIPIAETHHARLRATNHPTPMAPRQRPAVGLSKEAIQRAIARGKEPRP